MNVVRFPLTSIWSIKQDLSGGEAVIVIKSKLAFSATFVLPAINGKKVTPTDLWQYVPRVSSKTFAFASQESFIHSLSSLASPATSSSSSSSSSSTATATATAMPNDETITPVPSDGWAWFNLKEELTRLIRGCDVRKLLFFKKKNQFALQIRFFFKK